MASTAVAYFAQEIQRLRRAGRLSQLRGARPQSRRALAAKAGVNDKWLAALETGRLRPGFEPALKLMARLERSERIGLFEELVRRSRGDEDSFEIADGALHSLASQYPLNLSHAHFDLAKQCANLGRTIDALRHFDRALAEARRIPSEEERSSQIREVADSYARELVYLGLDSLVHAIPGPRAAAAARSGAGWGKSGLSEGFPTRDPR